MSKELDELTTQVRANTDLEASAIALIQGIAAQLVAAKEDPVKVAALGASLKASASALAEAMEANTGAGDPKPADNTGSIGEPREPFLR